MLLVSHYLGSSTSPPRSIVGELAPSSIVVRIILFHMCGQILCNPHTCVGTHTNTNTNTHAQCPGEWCLISNIVGKKCVFIRVCKCYTVGRTWHKASNLPRGAIARERKYNRSAHQFEIFFFFSTHQSFLLRYILTIFVSLKWIIYYIIICDRNYFDRKHPKAILLL